MSAPLRADRPSGAPRARWFDAGNLANGFLVFGNVVTGFIAVGNVARGFIAIGNVAVGVIAIGNVAVGVVGGFGATIAVGAIAAAGVFGFPVLDGVAGVASALELHPLLSVLPLGLWVLAARLFPGRRAPRPGPRPALAPLGALLCGARDEGWVKARVERAGEGALRLTARGGSVELPMAPAARRAAAALLADGRGARLLVQVRAEERIRGGERGYRAAPERERVLTAADLAAPPAWVPPWINGAEVQWWLARAWSVGAAAALVLRAAQLVAGALG
ncbi:hypothetical protein SOCEGT47_009560 [Sorangium cellulosum]|uniref:Uncharacterized protein n=1 Tax=Sorangium cellulosum TaxID=56 RepID=A0A4P2PUX1_SORCE|nr:hypothetical protein [Sorangium cellulosum]AUX20484.1 hypothetical protein SOCEGT47_009560 [Sorangium cellulosum]